MTMNKALIGAIVGAGIAVLWKTFDGGAVALVIALAAGGGLLGYALDRPGALIALLERLQDD